VVYNNINKIFSVKEKLENWMPGISMTVIHAKMRTEVIEKNLMDFIQKKFQVLISTTIIENGIDIPDVNTLIVMDAHRFGLTQLYQLRGRIGRGSRQAYAYFLIDSESVTDQARARLEAIRDFADLGSGYQLAEFDLKLRGAGSLLGNKQHGHIEALGFEYYHRMLMDTIDELKGEMEKKKEPECRFHFNYAIDQSYIPSPGERVSLYKRILEVGDLGKLDDLKLEMTDRYGRPPAAMERIYFAGFIRLLTRKYQIPEADVYLERLILKFQDPSRARSILDSDISKIIPLGPDEDDGIIFYFKKYTDFIEILKQHLCPLLS
jgi:transcription-repair coupling factor (superfamily II helicase)